MAESITVTNEDRQRLGTLLRSLQDQGGGFKSHLEFLGAELERSRAVESTEVSPDVVTMDSTVQLRDLATGEAETYTLVYPNDADISQNRISILAPVATAILGNRVGDIVTVSVPSGERSIRVERILFQPEHADELV